MNLLTFTQWLDIIKYPMIIDHEMTLKSTNNQIPNNTTMTVYFRKRGVLLAIKINKNNFGALK